jgi:transglutaminase-like putative cysteine protease
MRIKQAAPLLTPFQVAWLGTLLVSAQWPLWGHVLTWNAIAGAALVFARVVLPPKWRALTRHRRWLLPLLAIAGALGIRSDLGYFLARDPCVEFLYLLVGIKFIESRDTRDGTLLICLALFLSLTQFFFFQTITSMLSIVVVLLALGGTLGSLRGAAEASAAAAASDWRGQLRESTRLILQGIPLALLLFVLFPRLAGPLWGTPTEAGGRSGLSDTMSPGSISDLSLSDAVAFRVDFKGPPPPPPLRYWRGPVLSRFDGREWRAVYKLLPGRFVSPRGSTVEYTVTLEPHGKVWLFALEHPTDLPRSPSNDLRALTGTEIAFLSYDQQLIAKAPVAQAIRYTQRSSLRDTYSGTDENPRESLQLPSNNPRTLAFAKKMRQGFDSDRAYINAVLKWFHNEPFVYTLAPGPTLDHDPVDGFLFDTRRGFCEHYAGAFTVLLRAAGIPARVVTGYQGGEMNPDGDYMIVRQSDAHAWAEALLDGQWQRFDPTAAVAPSRIEHGLGSAMAAGEPVPYLARLEMTWLKDLRLQWDAVNYQWQRGVVGFNIERQRDLLREFGFDDARPWQLVAVVAVAALIWGMLLLGATQLRRSRIDAEVALWNALCRRLGRAGLARAPEEGPLAYTRRAGQRWPRWAGVLARIGERYAQLHYGPPEPGREQILAEMKTGVKALPGPRALNESSRSTSVTAAQPETIE